MPRTASDVTTPDPACCTANSTLDQVAKLMVENHCGKIPILGVDDESIGSCATCPEISAANSVDGW